MFDPQHFGGCKLGPGVVYVSSWLQSSGIGESQTTDRNTEREERTSQKEVREKVEDVG